MDILAIWFEPFVLQPRSFHTFQKRKEFIIRMRTFKKCSFFYCVRAFHNILLPAEWSFFRFFTQFKSINCEDEPRSECISKRLRSVHVSPMMINTPEKVPVYLFDVCDHIPSWCTSRVLSSLWLCMRNIRTQSKFKWKNKNEQNWNQVQWRLVRFLVGLVETERFSHRSNKSFLPESHRTHNFTWTLPAGFMRRAIFQKQWGWVAHATIKVHPSSCWIQILLFYHCANEHQHYCVCVWICTRSTFRPGCLLASVISVSCDVSAKYVRRTPMKINSNNIPVTMTLMYFFRRFWTKKSKWLKWNGCTLCWP